MLLILCAIVLALIRSWPERGSLLRSRGVSVEDEIAFASTVAGATRAGASLRRALGAGLQVLPLPPRSLLVRRCEAGVPLDRLTDDIANALPTSGRSVAATLALASHDGGAVAPLFDHIAEAGRSRLAVERRRRVALAQSRLSALVVGGFPLVIGAVMLATGRFSVVFAAGGVASMALALGAVLQLLGLAVIGVLVRRAR